MSIQLDKRSNIQAPATNYDPAKKLRKNTCLKCNKHHDTLQCTKPGCPIVIHKHCMPCVPRFDDKGNFLCPYCVYKRSVDECRKTKELVLVAKKNLANFMDAEAVKTTEDSQTVKKTPRPDEIHTWDSENLKTKCTSSEQSKVNLKNDDRSAEIQKGQCDDRQTLVRSPIDGGFEEHDCGRINEESSLPKSKEDRHLRDRHKMLDEKETPSKTTGHAEAVNLASVNDSVHENENISKIHEAVNKNNTDGICEVGDIQKADERGKQIKLQKNDEISTRKGNTGVSYEEFDTEEVSESSQMSHQKGYSLRCKRKREISVDSDSSNESKKASGSSESEFEEYEEVTRVKSSRRKIAHSKQLEQTPISVGRRKKTPLKSTVHAKEVNMASENQHDKNDDRLAQEVENVEVSNIEGKVNDSVREDENISRIQKEVNKNNTDETGEKADEREKQVKLLKNDVISTRGRKTGEFDSEEESESSQLSHQKGYSLRCKRKRKISVDSDSSNESEKASGSSESEFEESEEVTQVKKSRRKIAHSKQLEQTPISIGRRKKLPWTEEEEDILKEAVDKISLTVKKNMPWTKILEYGSHIFDGTRTPDDLKDKWRRIVNKAHENA